MAEMPRYVVIPKYFSEVSVSEFSTTKVPTLLQIWYMNLKIFVLKTNSFGHLFIMQPNYYVKKIVFFNNSYYYISFLI